MDGVIIITSGSSSDSSMSSTNGSFCCNTVKPESICGSRTMPTTSLKGCSPLLQSDDESSLKKARPIPGIELGLYSSRNVHSLSDSDGEDEGLLGGHTSYAGGLELSFTRNTRSPRSDISTQSLDDIMNKSESKRDLVPENQGRPTDSPISLALKDPNRLIHVLSDDSEDDLVDSNSLNRINFEESFINSSRPSQESFSTITEPRSSSSTRESQRVVHTLSDDSDDGAWMRRSQDAILTHKNQDEETSKRSSNGTTIKNKKPHAETSRTTLNKKELAEERRNLLKKEKENKMLEKRAKLAEQAQVKAMKQATAKLQKIYKPEECLKYVTAVLDRTLFDENFGGDLKESLLAVEVSYTARTHAIPMTIIWTRNVPIDDIIKVHEEPHALVVIPVERLIMLVKSKGLLDDVQVTQSLLPDKKLSLVLHGMENYFRSLKNGKSNDTSRVSREEVTEALIEVQLFAGCDHRLIDSSLELATLISQFTKAVAEIPYRLEKNKKDEDKLDWFGESDNRDCVRVDKNGNGLLRLWQQQLCEFNLAGLQMAEAITAIYPCPQDLFQAYSSCSTRSEGEKLLQDIPIRRGVGALSSVRRIGPELSKKLHTFFTSVGGEADMSQE